MFAQIMFVQIASTLPPPLHIPLFIGITDAVEATQKVWKQNLLPHRFTNRNTDTQEANMK